MEDDVRRIIIEKHGDDESQKQVIFSDEPRIVVEAPAGCGKTTTMVSKVAYMLANNKILNNKKILALTFSVNVAYKMKKDIAEKLPAMGISQISCPDNLNKLMYISNYHGLSRRILSLYGYLIDDCLKNINNFKSVNENEYMADITFKKYDIKVSESEKSFFEKFNKLLLDCRFNEIKKQENRYIKILKDKFLPNGCITFNGYLILARKLLEDNLELRSFYQSLFPMIIIDEFQDTNCLSWELLCMLINDNTNLFFMGDPLQRIYGFIGAIPNLLEDAKVKYNMKKMELSCNHRFKNNEDILWLDKNIRANAQNPIKPSVTKVSTIKLHYENTHEKECAWIVSKIKELQHKSPDDTTAILVQQRGTGVNMIIEELEKNNIEYFYALFSDEDEEYIEFHRKASEIFFQTLNSSRNNRINKTFLDKVYSKILAKYRGNKTKLIESLLLLTNAFFCRIAKEYIFLGNEEKVAYIGDTFENRALKQNMDLIDSKLYVLTVHGAKGLEWDYVMIPDLEPYCFPNYLSLCGSCNICGGRKVTRNNKCEIVVENHDMRKYLEEISVFYVAVTRMRKDLFFSASGTRYNAQGKKFDSKISCLASLPGISFET